MTFVSEVEKPMYLIKRSLFFLCERPEINSRRVNYSREIGVKRETSISTIIAYCTDTKRLEIVVRGGRDRGTRVIESGIRVGFCKGPFVRRTTNGYDCEYFAYPAYDVETKF